MYFSPRRLILRFSRNVSATEALSRYCLACCSLRITPAFAVCSVVCSSFAKAFNLHCARHIRGAVSYVAIAWFLIPAFYSKTLMRPGLSLYSIKPCPLVLPVENDLSWLQLGPPPAEVDSALHCAYSAQHIFLHFVNPSGLVNATPYLSLTNLPP